MTGRQSVPCAQCRGRGWHFEDEGAARPSPPLLLAAIEGGRRRAAGICVAEARACNRVIVSEGIAAALALQQGEAWAATASVEQMNLLRERRDALMDAARKIMGK